jgi:hypothetical protein
METNLKAGSYNNSSIRLEDQFSSHSKMKESKPELLSGRQFLAKPNEA